jgi:hypothetical protein
MAEDEPLCEELRAKNNALGLQMMQKKGQQEREQTEFAKLKEEKRELSERKVFALFISILYALMTVSEKHYHGDRSRL